MKDLATVLAGLVGTGEKSDGDDGAADAVKKVVEAIKPALKATEPSASGDAAQPSNVATSLSEDDGRYDDVKLPNACVGWLKGKQGGMIRDIEHRSGAQVDIDQSMVDSGFSMAKISGGSLQKKLAHGLVVAEVMKVKDQSAEPFDFEIGIQVDFRIDQQYVGWIKGPRGKVVQDIQCKSGTRIDVDQRGPDPKVAIVKFFGTAEGTAHARKLMASELSKVSEVAAEDIVKDLPGGLDGAKAAASLYEFPPTPPSAPQRPPVLLPPPPPPPSGGNKAGRSAMPPLAKPTVQLSMKERPRNQHGPRCWRKVWTRPRNYEGSKQLTSTNAQEG